jgi:hypothetical protein
MEVIQMYRLKWGTYSHKINGSRIRFEEGDEIKSVPERHLKKWPDRFEKVETNQDNPEGVQANLNKKVIDNTNKENKVAQDSPDVTESISKNNSINKEDKIEKYIEEYREKYGWYNLPFLDRKVRKSEAIEIIKEKLEEKLEQDETM